MVPLEYVFYLFCVCLLCSTCLVSQTEPLTSSKETHLSFYAHDFLSDANITDVAFAGIPCKIWNYDQFATVYAEDAPLTEGMDLKSASVGRIQGMFMVSSLDGRNSYDMLSIVFTNKEYNGSTLQIQGID